MLDYRMETFLTLCKLMSYRKTAEALHITQPAVTQHIHYLEQIYECRLFLYQNRHLSLTEQGKILESYGKSMKYHENVLRNELKGNPQKLLRIGATKTIGDYVIGEQVCRYLQKPENGLSLIVDNTKSLLQLLNDEKLDFALIEGEFDKRQYAWRLYRQEPFVGICPKEHDFCNRQVCFSELFSQCIICREQGSGTRGILEHFLASHGASLNQFQRCNSISSFRLICQTVEKGLGISFVYKVLADSYENLGQFTIAGESIVREFNVVYLKHAELSDKLSMFLEPEIL